MVFENDAIDVPFNNHKDADQLKLRKNIGAYLYLPHLFDCIFFHIQKYPNGEYIRPDNYPAFGLFCWIFNRPWSILGQNQSRYQKK